MRDRVALLTGAAALAAPVLDPRPAPARPTFDAPPGARRLIQPVARSWPPITPQTPLSGPAAVSTPTAPGDLSRRSAGACALSISQTPGSSASLKPDLRTFATEVGDPR